MNGRSPELAGLPRQKDNLKLLTSMIEVQLSSDLVRELLFGSQKSLLKIVLKLFSRSEHFARTPETGEQKEAHRLQESKEQTFKVFSFFKPFESKLFLENSSIF